jgi:hypothetical protein
VDVEGTGKLTEMIMGVWQGRVIMECFELDGIKLTLLKCFSLSTPMSIDRNRSQDSEIP